jgi:uncharacterized protein (DUF697 family)
MTRKPLPKAIRQPLENFRDFAAGGLDETAPLPRRAASFDPVEAEPALAISSVPAANDPFPAASEHVRSLAAKRRVFARKIVDRHRNFAALGGLLPLPVVNIASVTAVNLRMVKQLSDLYQVPFQRDRTRSLIVGLIGGAVPTGMGTATSATLMWIVPGGLLWGLGVSAITAAALTRGIGLVFLESFESDAMAGSGTAA